MYLDFFQLKDYPFSLLPDPAFIYMSNCHAKAKSYMDYSIHKQDGFVVITGDIGSGKTTLIEYFLTNTPEDVLTYRIHQTQLDDLDLLQSIAVEFGLNPFRKKKVQVLKLINEFAEQAAQDNKSILLIFDEAQNLSYRALEELRLLSDTEIEKKRIINVLLVGQRQLNELIDHTEMEQLAQRVRLRFHIRALTLDETAAYIQTRLDCAACKTTSLFDNALIKTIHQHTDGIPRRINILCDTILTAAFAEAENKITQKHLELALQELNWTSTSTIAESKDSIIEKSSKPFAKIIIRESNTVIDELPISSRNYIIGRSKRCDLSLDDPRTSSVHAQIISNTSSSCLIDLGSTNGTKVNGKKTTRHWLEDGDVIGVGKKYQLEFFRLHNEGLDNLSADDTLERTKS